MTFSDALKRLAGCRAAQPGLGQVLVASEVVDALLAGTGESDYHGPLHLIDADAPCFCDGPDESCPKCRSDVAA